ncbi:MAG: NAD+ synthase [Phycisphaerales bacterium]|nr:NAD+ synthase [Phycisphaerales bacterium]
MRIALAQINPTVGDLGKNAALIAERIAEARERGADLVVFPELAICGYPPKDLLQHEGFVEACRREAEKLASETDGITAIIGCPLPMPGGGTANALLAFRDGETVARYDKRLLPTYDVFDEDRYFTPGETPVVIEVAGVRVGLSVCEDLWKGEDAGFAEHYTREPDPVGDLVEAGAQIVVSPSASPFVLGKGRRHRDILIGHAKRRGVFVASVNQVGGNDELLFDGHACVFGPDGKLVAAAPGFEEHLLIADIDPAAGRSSNGPEDPRIEASAEELVFKALTMGVRDYCRKTGFERVVLGVSGGIDSAVVAAIAAAALGPDKVLGVSMPGPYSSEHSKSDARELAERLGIELVTVPIGDSESGPMRAIKGAIDPAFESLGERRLGETLPDVAEENTQSRLRGVVVMAISNRTGALVLTTGNKSELAVGYCTLYGDMNGGLAVLSDVSKRLVYRLAEWMNEHHEACGFSAAPIPRGTIDKPPSAELAPGQKDADTLPDYATLDEIVRRFVEERQSATTITRETGFDEKTVTRVLRMIDINEYKRKQLAIGLKITSVAFGTGRRMPIARGWHAG